MLNSGIKQLTVELEVQLRKRKAPILNRLNPGKTDEELRSIFDGINIPQELYALYEWKDGTTRRNGAIGECWLFKMGSLLTSEKAVQRYRKNVNRDEYWLDGMFPVFESLGGDYYLLDINEGSPTFGMVFFYSLSAVDFEAIISKYDSLETLLSSVLECYVKGAYSYDQKDNTLLVNAQVEQAVNIKYNPKSAYWTLFR